MKKAVSFLGRGFVPLVHITLVFMMVSWVCPVKIHGWELPYYEVSFVLLAVCFAAKLLCDFGFSPAAVCKHYFQMLRASKPLVISLSLYLLYGAITVFFAKYRRFALGRYITIVQMLCFCLFIIYYVFPKDKANGGRKLSNLLVDLGLSSVIISSVAIVGYLTGEYTVYLRKISTVVDYNQFSIVIMVGFVSALAVLIRSEWNPIKKYIVLTAVSVLDASVILLSSSRRSFVLMAIFAAAGVAAAVAGEIAFMKKNRFERRDMITRQVCVILSTVMIWCAVGGAIEGFESIFDRRYEAASKTGRPTEFVTGELENGEFIVEKDIQSRMESIASMSSINRRIEIWNIALTELKERSALQMIFGGGASASWDIYDDLSDSSVRFLHSEYGITEHRDHWMNTHNLLLNDLVEGGIVLSVLQLSLLAIMLVFVIRLIKRRPEHGLVLMALYVIIFSSLFISAPNGMAWNKLFWLLLCCQMCGAGIWLGPKEREI